MTNETKFRKSLALWLRRNELDQDSQFYTMEAVTARWRKRNGLGTLLWTVCNFCDLVFLNANERSHQMAR